MTSIMPQTGYEKADLAHLCGNSTREIVITRASCAAEGAHQLGRPADVRRWTRLAERTRDAFNHHYLEIDGRIRSDADTVYALAIHLGLCVG